MNVSHHNNSFVAFALVSIKVLCIGSPAFGDVYTATYTDDSLFHYAIAHMPDLDQKRDGLPGDGSCYCVPTSAMNMIMYVANHGSPEVEPGPPAALSSLSEAQRIAVVSVHALEWSPVRCVYKPWLPAGALVRLALVGDLYAHCGTRLKSTVVVWPAVTVAGSCCST